jgi:hypothetical protein
MVPHKMNQIRMSPRPMSRSDLWNPPDQPLFRRRIMQALLEEGTGTGKDISRKLDASTVTKKGRYITKCLRQRTGPGTQLEGKLK